MLNFHRLSLDDSDSFWTTAKAFGHCSPWVAFATVYGGVNAFWVACLAACQAYQVFWLAMTTNERMNAARYTHFHASPSRGGGIKSPFDRGLVRNCIDFYGG